MTSFSLVVRTTVPVIIEQPTDEHLSRREALKKQIELIANEVAQLQTRLRMMDLNLSACNRDVVNELTHLNSEIAALKEELEAKKQREAPPEPEPEPGVEEEPQDSSEDDQPKDTPEQTDRKRKRKLKELFARIAKRCHPDKTKNEHLHALFARAKKGRDQGDYELLLYIWNEVEGTKSRLLDKMLLELSVLERELQTKQFELAVTRSGSLIRILPMYEDHKTRDSANQIFRMSIQQVVLQRKRELMALRGTWPSGQDEPTFSFQL